MLAVVAAFVAFVLGVGVGIELAGRQIAQLRASVGSSPEPLELTYPCSLEGPGL